MRKLIGIVIIIFLTACSSSNNVVNNNIIQKRKYTKGFHIKSSSRINQPTAQSTQKDTNSDKSSISTKQDVQNREHFQSKNATKEELTASVGDNHIPISKALIEDLLQHKTVQLKIESERVKNQKDSLLTPKISSQSDDLKLDGFALTGFIAGILGFPIPYFIIPAIVFSAIGLNRINKNPETKKGRGFALAGLILGITSFILWVLILILIIAIILAI